MAAIFMVGLTLNSCASYAPSLVRLNPTGPNIKTAENDQVKLYVEEHGTKEKSHKAFDSDLSSERVLPLLVLVENKSSQPLDIRASNFSLRGEQPLKALSPEEAATRAHRNLGARALGWSLIVPIISIPVAVAASAIHTSKVNQQIVHDFAAKALQDITVQPNKEVSGFLYFELDEGRTGTHGLRLELITKSNVTGEASAIVSELPSVSFLPTSAIASQEESEQE